MKTKIAPGVTFRSVYADSNPLWKVIRSKGRGVWLCEITPDSEDWGGTQKAFLSTEINAAIGWSNTLDSMHDSHDKFYAGLTVGQTIHYQNGFDNWVRCTVVRKDGKNILKPIALVGIWKHDLPCRLVDGTVAYSHYPEMIAKGETFTPNASNLFEFGCKARNGVNPNTYKPIDLTLPPMTAEKEKVAAQWQHVYKIKEALEGENPAEILRKVRLIAALPFLP